VNSAIVNALGEWKSDLSPKLLLVVRFNGYLQTVSADSFTLQNFDIIPFVFQSSPLSLSGLLILKLDVSSRLEI